MDARHNRRRMAKHTDVEWTADASGGRAWYGPCSWGWRGGLGVSEQGAREDAAAHRQAAIAGAFWIDRFVGVVYDATTTAPLWRRGLPGLDRRVADAPPRVLWG